MEIKNNERVVRLIQNIEDDLRSLKQLLDLEDNLGGFTSQDYASFGGYDANAQTIDGIFDGEKMVDETGKAYQISPNYASKSKLVEGDPLKLYITSDGKFYYKQLGPVERRTIPGTLKQEGSQYIVEADEGDTYKILTASVTYYMSLFNIRPNDRVMIMIPANKAASWAVIDNVI